MISNTAPCGARRWRPCRIDPAGRCPIRPTWSSSAVAMPASRPLPSWPAGASASRCSRPGPSAGVPPPATAGSSIPATSGVLGSSSSGTARRPAGRCTTIRSPPTRTSSGSSPTRRSTATSAKSATWSSPMLPSHVRELEQLRESLAGRGVQSMFVHREKLRDEIGSDVYHAGLVDPGRRPGPSRTAVRRAGRGGRSGRCRPARGRPGADRPPAGRRPVHGGDGAWRDPCPRRVRRHERLYRRRGARPAAPDHPDRQLHHRHRAPARRPGRRALADADGPSSTRRTSCTTGTCRPTSGWSSAAGPACSRRASTRRPASSTTG